MSWYGFGQWFYSTQFPSDWLQCNGALIPSEYTAAKAVLGNYMPDLRERFLRVRDTQSIGTLQADSLKSHLHSGPNHTHPVYYTGVALYPGSTWVNSLAGAPGSTSSTGYAGTGNTGSTGDTETRPKCVYLAFCLYMKEGYPMSDFLQMLQDNVFDENVEKAFPFVGGDEVTYWLTEELINMLPLIRGEGYV